MHNRRNSTVASWKATAEALTQFKREKRKGSQGEGHNFEGKVKCNKIESILVSSTFIALLLLHWHVMQPVND